MCVCVCVCFLGRNLNSLLPIRCSQNSLKLRVQLSGAEFQISGFTISHQCDREQVCYLLQVSSAVQIGNNNTCSTGLRGWLRGPDELECIGALYQSSRPIKMYPTAQRGLHRGPSSLAPDKRRGITESASGLGWASGTHTSLLYSTIFIRGLLCIGDYSSGWGQTDKVFAFTELTF